MKILNLWISAALMAGNVAGVRAEGDDGYIGITINKSCDPMFHEFIVKHGSQEVIKAYLEKDRNRVLVHAEALGNFDPNPEIENIQAGFARVALSLLKECHAPMDEQAMPLVVIWSDIAPSSDPVSPPPTPTRPSEEPRPGNSVSVDVAALSSAKIVSGPS